MRCSSLTGAGHAGTAHFAARHIYKISPPPYEGGLVWAAGELTALGLLTFLPLAAAGSTLARLLARSVTPHSFQPDAEVRRSR